MVNTLNVNGFAITAPSFAASVYNDEINKGASVSGQSPISLTMPSSSSGAVFVAVVQAGGARVGSSTLTISLQKNGSTIASNNYTVAAGSTASSTLTAYDPSPTGSNVYSLRIGASVRDMTYWSSSLLCIGAKR